MSTVFSCDSFTLVSPYNNTDGGPNYFGLSTTFDPPEQVLQKWGYIGQHGQQIKKLGTNGQSGTVIGFIEAGSEALINTGVILMQAACKDATPGTINIGTGVSIGNGMLIRVVFPRLWAHGNRFCMDFVLVWEAP